MAATLDAFAAPSRLSAQYPTRLCQICQQPTDQLKRGHRIACYGYWQKYGRERPPELWRRDFTGRRRAFSEAIAQQTERPETAATARARSAEERSQHP